MNSSSSTDRHMMNGSAAQKASMSLLTPQCVCVCVWEYVCVTTEAIHLAIVAVSTLEVDIQYPLPLPQDEAQPSAPKTALGVGCQT